MVTLCLTGGMIEQRQVCGAGLGLRTAVPTALRAHTKAGRTDSSHAGIDVASPLFPPFSSGRSR